MISLLKRILRTSSRAPMQRWSPENLKSVKERLESRGSEPLSREETYLFADYLAYRYLPDDYQATEREWKNKLAAVHKRIDNALDRDPNDPEPEPHSDPEFTKWMHDMLKRPDEK